MDSFKIPMNQDKFNINENNIEENEKSEKDPGKLNQTLEVEYDGSLLDERRKSKRTMSQRRESSLDPRLNLKKWQ